MLQASRTAPTTRLGEKGISTSKKSNPQNTANLESDEFCRSNFELSFRVYLAPLGRVAAGKLVGRSTAKTESSNTLNLETARYINSNCLMPIISHVLHADGS